MSADLVTTGQHLALWGGAASAGTAAWLFACQVGSVASRFVSEDAQLWQFDDQRLMALRSGCSMYRWCEPFVRGMEATLPRWPFISTPQVKRFVHKHLRRGGDALPWQPDEFIASSLFLGLLVGLVCFPLLRPFTSPSTAWLTAICAPVLVVLMSLRELAKRSAVRMELLRKKLPFCIDLMALMMEAGADLGSSLQAVVMNTPQSPVGEEFGRIMRETTANKPMVDSFEDFRDRLQDPDITEVVTAIVRGHEQGTPQSAIFLQLADQLRLRRTQWVEKRSGQMQTMMTFPCFVIMFAGLLIILAPFAITMSKEWSFS